MATGWGARDRRDPGLGVPGLRPGAGLLLSPAL